MRIRNLLTLFIVAAVCFALSSVVRSQENGNSGRKAIEGSWQIVVTADPSPPGAPPAPPPFEELITFTSNGGLVETNNVFAPAAASPGHGSWRASGNRTYDFTFIKLLFDTAGRPSGKLRVRGQVVLDINKNQFTDVAFVDFFDAADNLLFTTRTTAQATRIQVLPM